MALKQGPNLGYRLKNGVIVRLYGPKTGSKLGLLGSKRCQSCQIHQNCAGQHAHCCCYRAAANAATAATDPKGLIIWKENLQTHINAIHMKIVKTGLYACGKSITPFPAIQE
jgi:hypothetical protein